METTVLMKGTGAELLAHADEWKDYQNLELSMTVLEDDAIARLEQMGADG